MVYGMGCKRMLASFNQFIMRPLFQRSGVPTGRSSIAKKAILLSLIAAPVVFLEAPSQAGTKLITSTGFTGQFGSTNWKPLATGGGQNTFTATTLTQTKPGNSGGQASVQQQVTPGFIASFSPKAFWTFIKATVNYDYSWTGPTSVWNFNKIGPYTPTGSLLANAPNTAKVKLNTSNPLTGSVTQTVLANQAFGFNVERAGGPSSATIGTAVISNFKVAAEYEVPGPLPLAGAAAAFAWSRKLRNRLKLSESIG
jgi:hypothetical protein